MLKPETTGVKYTNMSNISYISGAMHYPYIFEGKVDKFDRYSVVLTLEGDQVKNAKNFGLKVNQDDNKFNGMAYVSLKSSFPPKLFNADKTPYSGPTRLANGSTAVAKISQRPYDNKFGKGVTNFVMALMITDPIEFVPDGASGGTFDDFNSLVAPRASGPLTVPTPQPRVSVTPTTRAAQKQQSPVKVPF